ncbi:glutathione synthase/RimK-type ligase-like ATP-grasp enzyme [Cohnella sp. SGD-V74]|mgnify:CR=1 FL=1|uniref:YheC/YheD family endospore coat-associated protein n=1 Tax=unclassified Cohnella TaxID=2636738 RepID=UPI000D425D36|nr:MULTISPECIES: YheC/YheD family protein [unclassified Cohnella]PRX71216.1 glutathione synthase/RimK-type ligase-like ATP-grasp enzyme [Cohnella sp. SGD-V74]
MRQPVLGILTLYLNESKALEERPVYEKMIAAGKRIGLSVFVFTPQDVDDAKGLIRAQLYNTETKKWSRRWVRFPNVIYDRCRIQKSYRFEQLLAFRKRYSHLHFLNRPLRNKWTVYRTLSKVPAFRAHLPTTKLYQSPEDVSLLLKRYPTVYLKPINGTGGRGILRIERARDGTLLLQGRNHSRSIVQPRHISRGRLASALESWDKKGDRYIVQQGLNIKLPSGRVHDYRMLVQKNGSGVWEVTGCAGRIGPLRSITSNLHGGGEAASMNDLLRQWIGSENDIRQIRQTAEAFGVDVARHLEATYGALCELALDLAIDRNGRIWLIEVNPKPSREVFQQAGERDVYRKAIVRPIEYALWAYREKRGLRAPKAPPGVSAGAGAIAEHRSSSEAAEGADASYGLST